MFLRNETPQIDLKAPALNCACFICFQVQNLASAAPVRIKSIATITLTSATHLVIFKARSREIFSLLAVLSLTFFIIIKV